MDGVRSWFDYMSSRTDLIVEGLTQTLMYVVVVIVWFIWTDKTG